METTMEIDDLKQAWQTLDRRLERSHALQLQLHRDNKLGQLRRGLRPLVFGQTLQIIVGAVIALLSASFWIHYRQEPAFLAMGILMHVYGVAAIIHAGVTIGWLSQIDYAAPVLHIQKRLARVRKLYVYGGMALGLPWWLLWIVVMAMLAKAGADVDVLTRAPGFFWGNIGFGVLGLLGTLWFLRWSRRPERPRLAQAIESLVVGRSLRRAQTMLDDIARFED